MENAGHFEYYCPPQTIIDDKAESSLGRYDILIDKWQLVNQATITIGVVLSHVEIYSMRQTVSDGSRCIDH